MRQAAEELTRYVPRSVLVRLAGQVPHEETVIVQGAVLFADITGFVARVERIARQGPGALELLQQLLNTVFGHFIESTYRSGGEVLKFAGDALLAVWTAPTWGPEEAVRAAAACALALQQQHFHSDAKLPELSDIRLRIGISAGALSHTVVGREEQGLALLPTGTPFEAMGQAVQAAAPGEVVVDGPASQLLGARAVLEPLPGGLRRLRGLVSGGPLLEHKVAPAPAVELAALRPFVPPTVLRRVDAGHAEWMAEVRPVTMLFINLKDPQLLRAGERSVLQAATLAVQGALAACGGCLTQVVTDDKGLVFTCIFGLPTLAHENDAERALRAALSIGEALRGQGLRHGMGITTGRAYCGTYGAASRCEYSALGDVVNLSARLMQRAQDEALCDEPTARMAQGRVELEALAPVQLKGKSAPVALYRVRSGAQVAAPLAGDTPTHLSEQPLLGTYRQQLERGLLGREHERAQVRSALAELAAGISSTLLFEAESGLGKSMLLASSLAEAVAQGLPCLVGRGDAIECSAAYRAWRPLLEALLRAEARQEAAAAEPLLAGLRGALADHPHGTEWEPLLADLLGLQLAENEVTRGMAAEVRGENMHELLVHLLERLMVRRSFVVAFDDAQWLDPDSWRLTVEVRRRLPAVLVVLSGRELSAVGEPYNQLLAAGRWTRVELGPLGREDAVALVHRRLGVQQLPKGLAELVYARAEGHPLFTEELVYALQGHGVIQVESGQCRLTLAPEQLREAHLPDSLQAAAFSRMDQCSTQQQLVLKVASVIGRSFGYRVVRDVLPVERDVQALDGNLEELVQRSLTRLELREPERVYAFQHGLLHQAAYELLATSQRRLLHRAVADWYERVQGTDPAVYPKLAHHWLEAAEVGKALYYLDLASTSAWGRGATREAVYLIERALALEEQAGLAHADPLRRARWLRTLGEAAFEAGASERALERYSQSLVVLGEPLPTSRVRWVWRLAVELGRVAVTAAWPRALRRLLSPEQRERMGEAGRCVTEVARERYNALDILSMITSSVSAVRHAERSDSFAACADAYNNLAFILGTLGLHGLAERLYARARLGSARTHCNQSYARALVCLGAGQLAEGIREAHEGLALAQRLGDRYCIVTGQSILGTLHGLSGELSSSLEQWEEMLEDARAHGNARHECWASSGMATVLSLQGRHEEAVAWARYCATRLPGADLLTGIGCHAHFSLIQLRAGDEAQARAEGAQALALWERSSLNVLPHVVPLTDASTTYLELWGEALAKGSAEAPALERVVESMSRRLSAYARQFAVGRSRAARVRGSMLWLQGRPAPARKAWAQSLAWARRLSLVVDEAYALWEMARHEPEGAPDRRERLEQAHALFERLGLVDDARRARALLGLPAEQPPVHAAAA